MKYMKIKFNSDLPLNKTIEIRNTTVVVGALFHKNNNYYWQVFFR